MPRERSICTTRGCLSFSTNPEIKQELESYIWRIKLRWQLLAVVSEAWKKQKINWREKKTGGDENGCELKCGVINYEVI